MSDTALQEAKRRLILPALLHQLGLGQLAKKTARCPFHDDGRNSANECVDVRDGKSHTEWIRAFEIAFDVLLNATQQRN